MKNILEDFKDSPLIMETAPPSPPFEDPAANLRSPPSIDVSN
jgi:hypothetical protein